MRPLTPEGQQKINEIAQRYRLSDQAVLLMLDAVSMGGGTMAQFNISELGGGGQWMQGGMTMVGDMFNYSLKNTVNNLCAELSQLLYSQNIFEVVPINTQNGMMGQNYGSWWPTEFGSPSSSGGQNNMRYAYFPNPVNRLAVDINGSLSIYDTFNYNISGVSQQQSGSGYTLSFSSQMGTLDITNLPIISPQSNNNNPVVQETPQYVEPAPVFIPEPQQLIKDPEPMMAQNNMASSSAEEDIIKNIERLAGLMQKGIVSEEEFNTKKRELLARL
jgi:superoxide dismutase